MNSRRKFLKRAFASTAAMGCYGALGLQLSAMKAFASQSRFDNHKALVCVFLYGGNDSFNMLIPTATNEYAAYQQTRQQIAYPLDALTALNLTNNDLSSHAMPSVMSPLVDLFNTGQLSIVSNVGPLVEPATKEQLKANPNKLPPLLFSHNSQQALWQTAGVDTQLSQGWLGSIADLLQDTNTSLPMNISIGSSDILSAGATNLPLVLNATGPEDFSLLNPTTSSDQGRLQAHSTLLGLANTPLSREYASRIVSARDNTEIIKAALATMPSRNAVYPEGNSLGAQLHMVANMISVQSSLSQSRQVFFVGLGGWDTHDNQPEQHPALLATLSEALAAFNTDIQAMNKSSDVTTLTLSEFGRTLTSNRDGTDHGWAGHQLIMGGAVTGARVIGHLPSQQLGTDDDLGDGRIIPTTSIEQLGASLATWFGMSENEISQIFPNIDRFDKSQLKLFTT